MGGGGRRENVFRPGFFSFLPRHVPVFFIHVFAKQSAQLHLPWSLLYFFGQKRVLDFFDFFFVYPTPLPPSRPTHKNQMVAPVMTTKTYARSICSLFTAYNSDVQIFCLAKSLFHNQNFSIAQADLGFTDAYDILKCH